MSQIEGQYDIHDPDVVAVIDDLPLWSAPFGAKLLEVVRLGRGLRVLDVGSGLGFPIVELSQRLGETCEVFGIDPWVEAIERVRLKIRTWKLANLRILEGVAESLPFADGSFDLIVSNNGTNNVDDEERAFAEIARVARRGAQLVITANLPGTMAEFYGVFRRVLRAAGRSAELERLEAHVHGKRKTVEHTRRVLAHSGFEVVDVHRDSFIWRYTDGTAMLDHFTIKLAFLGPWLEILDEAERSGLMSRVEEGLNELAESGGELTLTIPWACFDCRRA